MRAAVALWNIVGVTKHVFLVAVVPLQRGLNDNIILLRGEVNHRRVNRGLVAVQVIDKRLDAAFILEHFLRFIAFVDQVYSHTGIEERQLAQSSRKNFVVELDV